MWTFMLTGLSTGARLILYDGSPFHPDVHTYLKFISDQGSVYSFILNPQSFKNNSPKG